MKLETKSAIILVATLAIGVVLGMVSQGSLVQERARRVESIRKRPGFVREVVDAIRPRADQKDSVQAVVEATAARAEAIIEADRKALAALFDSMRVQLKPLLDEEQMQHLIRVSQLPDPNGPPRRPEDAADRKRPPRDDTRPPPPEGQDRRDPNRRPPPRDDARPPHPDNPPPPRPGDPRPPRSDREPPSRY